MSSFHDDSYMHAIQAYDANNNEPLIPPQKKFYHLVNGPIFDHLSTNPPVQPQAIEIRENCHGTPDTSYACHEEQIKDILNHLNELSLDQIEEIKDKIKGKEGCASWDGGKGIWGGRARVFGTVPVCVRVQERAGGLVPEVKDKQEKDKIRTKPDKNGKRGKAQQCQISVTIKKAEKQRKYKFKGPKMETLKLY
nr:hypothetical protein [Tanacetum cinerariifolium]